MAKVVLDTNVLVAAARSRHGASFRLLRMVGPGAPFQLAISVPLILEYEMALKRSTGLSEKDAEIIVDYLCRVADRRRIHFLWRPFLRDAADEMVLEVAVEAEAEVIVTHNVRDFEGVEERFGIRVLNPGAFLEWLEEKDK
jgi:predicted nucleic acid-binding protein